MELEFNNNRTLYEELSRKDLPVDQLDYTIVEYSGNFEDNGKKKSKNKILGEKFAQINSFFFDYLREYHIPSAFIKISNNSKLKFFKHERLPFSVKILNIVDKRTAKIFTRKECETLQMPVVQYHYCGGKDNIITESHLLSFNICTNEDLKIISRICSKVNAVLKSFFERRNAILAEVDCYFGKNDGRIYLVDDFTPKSIKILPANKESTWVNPYKLDTPNAIKKYVAQIHNMLST